MRVRNKHYKPYTIQWCIGVRKKKEGLLNRTGSFYILTNPKDGWVADPFLFDYKGDTYVFAEKWDYFKQKGEIVYSKVGPENDVSWETIIEESYHLSYPFIWKDEKGIHIIPESSGAGMICMYTAVDFPRRWRIEKVITYGSYADTTMYNPMNERGDIWLFSYGCEGIWNGKLIRMLLRNDRIVDRNVITKDKMISRQGGSFIYEESNVYRVAQNCADGYGTGLVFLNVEECSDGRYRETISFKVDCDEVETSKRLDIIGMHTYNRSDEYEVVDFRVRKFCFTNMLGFIKKQKRLSIRLD